MMEEETKYYSLLKYKDTLLAANIPEPIRHLSNLIDVAGGLTKKKHKEELLLIDEAYYYLYDWYEAVGMVNFQKESLNVLLSKSAEEQKDPFLVDIVEYS